MDGTQPTCARQQWIAGGLTFGAGALVTLVAAQAFKNYSMMIYAGGVGVSGCLGALVWKLAEPGVPGPGPGPSTPRNPLEGMEDKKVVHHLLMIGGAQVCIARDQVMLDGTAYYTEGVTKEQVEQWLIDKDASLVEVFGWVDARVEAPGLMERLRVDCPNYWKAKLTLSDVATISETYGKSVGAEVVKWGRELCTGDTLLEAIFGKRGDQTLEFAFTNVVNNYCRHAINDRTVLETFLAKCKSDWADDVEAARRLCEAWGLIHFGEWPTTETHAFSGTEAQQVLIELFTHRTPTSLTPEQVPFCDAHAKSLSQEDWKAVFDVVVRTDNQVEFERWVSNLPKPKRALQEAVA